MAPPCTPSSSCCRRASDGEGAVAAGGHLNPAVTLACVLTRKISLVRGVFYFIAQLAGATLGSAFVYAVRVLTAALTLANLAARGSPQHGLCSTLGTHQNSDHLFVRFCGRFFMQPALEQPSNSFLRSCVDCRCVERYLLTPLMKRLGREQPHPCMWPIPCLTLVCSLADGPCWLGGHEGRHQRPCRWAERRAPHRRHLHPPV